MTLDEINRLRAAADEATERLRRVVKESDDCPECEQGIAVWCQDFVTKAQQEKALAEQAVVNALIEYHGWRHLS